MVDKKLHENKIELENLDYAKRALKDTNNETRLIRAVTTNRTIGLLKHGLESQVEKSEGYKHQYQEEVKRRKVDDENYQHGKSSSPVRTPEHQISSSSLFVPLTPNGNDAPVRTPEHQISSSSSFVPLTTRIESDDEETNSDNFDTNKRDPKNFTFNEFVDGNDEYTVLDEDLGLKEAKKAVTRSFAKSFEDPADQETFDRMQNGNIPVNPLNDSISEGTLTVNIISPILRSFIHGASIHSTTWPNTASMSAKIRKLANLDPSRAKQPDMIEYKGESYGFCVAGDCDIIMILIAPVLYIMIDVGQIEFPKSFQTCGQFIDNIDKLFAFTKKYKYEIQKLRDDMNKKKKVIGIPEEII
ncbi:13043_t:CDS:2, partial [Racocetra persica]